MEYQDYYKILGVSREASPAEITKVYRKLARKYHPDVSKEKNAEEKLKKINEAYEVLKDPAKRSRYDALGSSWQQGEQFRPPPGWEGLFGNFMKGGMGAMGGTSFRFEGSQSLGGFSDFFETLFGGSPFGQGQKSPFRRPSDAASQPGTTHEVALPISIEDAYFQRTKTITVDTPGQGSKNYQVKIPAGVTDGSVIRLAGQGGKGKRGGTSGDLLVRLNFLRHPGLVVDGYDLVNRLSLAPWEAVLGAKIPVATLEGNVSLSIPPGTQSGTRFRLKEKGLLKKDGSRGNMLVETDVLVPTKASEEEKQLYRRLGEISAFNPRRQ